VNEPERADIGLRVADPGVLHAVRRSAAKMVRAHLRAAPDLWRELLASSRF